MHFLFSLILFLNQNSFLPVKSIKVLKHSYHKNVRFWGWSKPRNCDPSTFFLFRTLKKDCPFSIKLRASKDRCSLNVISISEKHNHEISEESNQVICFNSLQNCLEFLWCIYNTKSSRAYFRNYYETDMNKIQQNETN